MFHTSYEGSSPRSSWIAARPRGDLTSNAHRLRPPIILPE